MKLRKRELATVLAALRMFQARPSTETGHFEDVRPLGAKKIDGLCERLNCGVCIGGLSHRKNKVLKIVVHIEEGIVQAVYANVPKANVSVYDTDPEFRELEKEKRNLKRAIKGLIDVRK